MKFLDCYYFTLIIQKKKVGCIGANFVYSIKATEIFAVKPREEQDNNAFRQIWKKLNKKLNQTASEIAESRYMGLFQFVDLTKDFYFSYTYDLTHSLQHNFIMSAETKKSYPPYPPQEMFEWNYFQTEEMRSFNGARTAIRDLDNDIISSSLCISPSLSVSVSIYLSVSPSLSISV